MLAVYMMTNRDVYLAGWLEAGKCVKAKDNLFIVKATVNGNGKIGSTSTVVN